MGAYDSLKSLVRQYIKTNGQNEITGQILQNVLIAMIDDLGITIDPTPTKNSSDAVASGGAFDMIQDATNVNAIESSDGKIYNDYQAGDIFFIVDNNVRKYRVALVAGTADAEHPVTISPVNFYYALNSADAINLSLTLKTVSTEQQSLSTQQKAQARTNIAAVSYDQQSLSANQQVQAQNNVMGKAYNAAQFSGLGKKILAKNVQTVSGVDHNYMTQAFFKDGNVLITNTVFVIQYDYELKENVEIGAGCTLEFDGGSISGAHTLTGAYTGIRADLNKILGTDVIFAGAWNIPEIYPEWFGAKGDGINSDRVYLQKAIDLSVLLRTDVVLTKTYLIDSSLYFNQPDNIFDYISIIGRNNATIVADGNICLITSSIEYNGHPVSQYLKLTGLIFSGNSIASVIDNKIMRVSVQDCTFYIRLATCISYCQSWYIRNCKVAGYGLNNPATPWLDAQNGAEDFKMELCQFEYSNGSALKFGYSNESHNHAITISHSLFESIRGAAIEYQAAQIVVVGCYFEGNTEGHIKCINGSSNSVALIGNWFAALANGVTDKYRVLWWGSNNSISIGNGCNDPLDGHFHGFKEAGINNYQIFDLQYKGNDWQKLLNITSELENRKSLAGTTAKSPTYLGQNLFDPSLNKLYVASFSGSETLCGRGGDVTKIYFTNPFTEDNVEWLFTVKGSSYFNVSEVGFSVDNTDNSRKVILSKFIQKESGDTDQTSRILPTKKNSDYGYIYINLKNAYASFEMYYDTLNWNELSVM